MRTAMLVPVLLLCVSCVHRAPQLPPPAAGLITPMEAVRAANDDPQRGISGTFVLTVQNVDEAEHRIYLNSERDYRHQVALSISLDAAQGKALEAQLGLPLERLLNRRLLVTGTARRSTIHFTHDGVPSGKYYFQTQVQVRDPRHIRLAP